MRHRLAMLVLAVAGAILGTSCSLLLDVIPTYVVDSTRALVLRLGCLTPPQVRALAWNILDRG
jgi:hypothetical protein